MFVNSKNRWCAFGCCTSLLTEEENQVWDMLMADTNQSTNLDMSSGEIDLSFTTTSSKQSNPFRTFFVTSVYFC